MNSFKKDWLYRIMFPIPVYVLASLIFIWSLPKGIENIDDSIIGSDWFLSFWLTFFVNVLISMIASFLVIFTLYLVMKIWIFVFKVSFSSDLDSDLESDHS